MSTDTCKNCRYFLNSWTLTSTGKHVPVPLSFTCNDVFDVIYIYIIIPLNACSKYPNVHTCTFTYMYVDVTILSCIESYILLTGIMYIFYLLDKHDRRPGNSW